MAIQTLATKCSHESNSLSASTWSRQHEGLSDEESNQLQFRAEHISLTIQMLNHLATKDLLLDDDTTGSVVTSVSERQIIVQVVR